MKDRGALFVTALAALCVVLFAASAILSFLVQGASSSRNDSLAPIITCDSTAWAESNLEIGADGCPSVLDAYVTLGRIDTNDSREVEGVVRLYPKGATGTETSNGGILAQSVSVGSTPVRVFMSGTMKASGLL